MNREMDRRGRELPDPADLLPSDWRTLSNEHKQALYCEAWATLGANIAYSNDVARRGDWYQPTLPLLAWDTEFFVAASGWCAPERPEQSDSDGI